MSSSTREEAILDAAEIEGLLHGKGLVKRHSLKVQLESLAQKLKRKADYGALSSLKTAEQNDLQQDVEYHIEAKKEREQQEQQQQRRRQLVQWQDDEAALEIKPSPKAQNAEVNTINQREEWSDNLLVPEIESVPQKSYVEMTSISNDSQSPQTISHEKKAFSAMPNNKKYALDESHRVIWICNDIDNVSSLSVSIDNLQDNYPYFLAGRMAVCEWEDLCDGIKTRLEKSLDRVEKTNCLYASSHGFGILLFLTSIALYITNYINVIALPILIIGATLIPLLYRKLFCVKSLNEELEVLWKDLQLLCEQASEEFSASGLSFRMREWKDPFPFRMSWKCIDCYLLEETEELIDMDQGNVYVGEVKDGQPHGLGKFIKHLSKQYIHVEYGEYKDGKREKILFEIEENILKLV